MSWSKISNDCESGDHSDCIGIIVWGEGEYMCESDCECECHKEDKK